MSKIFSFKTLIYELKAKSQSFLAMCPLPYVVSCCNDLTLSILGVT